MKYNGTITEIDHENHKKKKRKEKPKLFVHIITNIVHVSGIWVGVCFLLGGGGGGEGVP